MSHPQRCPRHRQVLRAVVHHRPIEQHQVGSRKSRWSAKHERVVRSRGGAFPNEQTFGEPVSFTVRVARSDPRLGLWTMVRRQVIIAR